jgi:hypothetical protein
MTAPDPLFDATLRDAQRELKTLASRILAEDPLPCAKQRNAALADEVERLRQADLERRFQLDEAVLAAKQRCDRKPGRKYDTVTPQTI